MTAKVVKSNKESEVNRRLQAEIEMLQDTVARLQKGVEKEVQPLNSYFQPRVAPLQLSQLKLTGGQKEPYYYSLGADSTVPFISLSGGGANQKIISWGEIIKVEPRQTVTVKSESYMMGDIQINSGTDYCTRPAKISNIVETYQETIQILGPPDLTFIVSSFPADVRMARKAYVKYNIETLDNELGVIILGKSNKHSFPGSMVLNPFIQQIFGNLTAAYSTLHTIVPFSVDDTAGLGYAINGTDLHLPMALIDQAYFAIGPINPAVGDAPIIGDLFSYVIEY